MKNVWRALVSILAFFFILLLGKRRFYRLFQEDRSAFVRYLGRSLFEAPVAWLFANYFYRSAHMDRERVPSEVLKEYSSESLAGYGEAEYDKGGETLGEQQRGLILPLLTRAISELDRFGGRGQVVEIGAGNGDVTAEMARRFPGREFVGVDFHVENARHHSIDDLCFMGGYALDLLRAGHLRGELVFGSSTFILFTPRELESYLRAIREAGFREIVLNDPCWDGHIQRQDGRAISHHLQNLCWFHNYAGYFRDAAYEIEEFDFFPYRHPRSPRRNIHVLLIRGVRS